MSAHPRPRLRRWRHGLLALVAAAALLTGSAAMPATATPGHSPGGHSPVGRSEVQAAADVLMTSYDRDKAWFPSSWWNSAVALQTIGDYAERTGDRRYHDELELTFEQNQGEFPAGYLSGDELWGDFTSRAIDDSGWWALTWLQAYDLTGERKYLEMAERIGRFMSDYWDTDTCGGGIWWDAERTYKNAVTNGQWILITASLHNRIKGDTTWLKRSRTAWDWYLRSGLVNSDNLVNDGLTVGSSGTCRNNGQTVWSYNQGLAFGAGLELYRATGDPAVLKQTITFADAGTSRPALVTDGVLTESCDPVGRTCDDNAKQFKGVFMRYLMRLSDATRSGRYARFIDTQARTVWSRDRDAQNRLGARYAGASTTSSPNAFDWRTQASALSALIAVLPASRPERHSLSSALTPAATVVLPSQGTSSTVDFQLALALAAPGTARVSFDAKAPAGWRVRTPKPRMVRPSGRVAELEVPVSVTLPAGTAGGRHTVTVTARAGKSSWTAQAEILVATRADFETGTADEAPWLFDADGSASGGPGNRYADGNSSYTYRFPLPSDTVSASMDIHINNQFVVEASPDGSRWTTVLAETEQIRDASNDAVRTVDLTPYLSVSTDGSPRSVYVRVSDAFPEDGWGGQTSHVSVTPTRG